MFLLMARPTIPVILAASDQTALLAIVKKGTHKSRKITRARALLAMGAGKSRLAVQTEAGISATQYYGLKRRYLSTGLADALEERPRSGQPPKVTAALEAQITTLACSDAPAGAARWTLSLLNERLVSLDYVATISDETIRKVLKKVSSSPG
ncbi:MAG: helix-turn-helix domain-containing protein [Hymenobacter sp.]|nr:MAG: helix-turn-helix domain-containing protein [Hymenobacter sp.]